MKLRIFNYDYYNILENKEDPDLECPIFIIGGRDEDGAYHRVKIPGNTGIFRPHFYVKDNSYNRMLLKELDLEFEEWPYPSAYDENEKVLIAFTRFPFQVARLRSSFEHTYEADVKYAKMFMMQLNLEGGYIEVPDGREWVTVDEIKSIPEEEHFQVDARIFFFDIETDSINEKEDFDIDNCLIISMVVYDNYDNTYHTLEWSSKNYEFWDEVRTVQRKFKHPGIPADATEIIYHCISEKQLLKSFFNLFRVRPDAISGFNSHGGYEIISRDSKSVRVWHNGFDEPVIYKRALINGLIKDIQLMSPLPRFKNKYGNYYGVYNRGREGKFEVVIRCLTPLDFYYAEPLMRYTEKYRDFFGRSLDAYLKYFGKKGKVEHIGLSVADLKKQDLYKELEYNRIDVEGTFFLDQRFGFSKDIFDTVSLSQVEGIDVLSATKIHDFILLNNSKDKVVYDTKYQGWNRNTWGGWLKEKHGGYVVPVKKGVGGWTGIMDFSGLYPNLARAANAGVDTLIQVAEEFDEFYIDKFGKKWMKKDCIITPAAPFRTDKESVERQIWDKLLGFRDKYKKILADIYEKTGKNTDDPLYKLYWSKHYNLKTRLINNKYGASGNPGFRAKCKPVYNCMPSMGQILIQGLEREFLPEMGYKNRGGDTDSVFVALDSDNVEDAINEMENLCMHANIYIDKLLKEKFNITEHNIELDWEKIGPKFYGHMKKNYLMEVWAQDGKILPEKNRYIMYKGFEMKKRHRADITELVQRTFFKIALNSETEEEFMKKMSTAVKNTHTIFEYLPWTKICHRVNIRKHLKEYSPNYFGRRAAEFSNQHLGTNFGLGSHAFLGWMNKGDVRKSLQRVFLFNKEDIPNIKKNNVILDYKAHLQKFVVKKFDLFLEDYNTGFWRIYRAGRIKSVNVL